MSGPPVERDLTRIHARRHRFDLLGGDAETRCEGIRIVFDPRRAKARARTTETPEDPALGLGRTQLHQTVVRHHVAQLVRADPPRRIAREPDPPLGLEVTHRLDDTHRALLDEILEILRRDPILAREVHDETELRAHEAVLEASLSSPVADEHRVLVGLREQLELRAVPHQVCSHAEADCSCGAMQFVTMMTGGDRQLAAVEPLARLLAAAGSKVPGARHLVLRDTIVLVSSRECAARGVKSSHLWHTWCRTRLAARGSRGLHE